MLVMPITSKSNLGSGPDQLNKFPSPRFQFPALELSTKKYSFIFQNGPKLPQLGISEDGLAFE